MGEGPAGQRFLSGKELPVRQGPTVRRACCAGKTPAQCSPVAVGTSTYRCASAIQRRSPPSRRQEAYRRAAGWVRGGGVPGTVIGVRNDCWQPGNDEGLGGEPARTDPDQPAEVRGEA